MKVAALLLALLLCGKIDHSPIILTHVDLIEFNHYYDDNGKLVFDQCIYYRWKRTTVWDDPYLQRTTKDGWGFEVVAWRLIKPGRETLPPDELKKRQAAFEAEWNKKYPGTKAPPYTPPFDPGSMAVRKNYKTGKYEQIFLDRDNLRRIISGSFRHTWTQVDPELEARQLVPKDSREGLSKPRKLKAD